MEIYRGGLGTMVGSILLVLLTIIGVAVIWAVIKPALDRTSAGVAGAADCFSIQIEPVSCVADFTYLSGPLLGQAKTSIKRNVGSGDLKEIRLVYEGKIYNAASLSEPNPPPIKSATAIVTQDASALVELTTALSSKEIYDFSNSPLLDTLSDLAGAIPGDQAFIPTKVTVHAVVGQDKHLCPSLSAPISCSCASGNEVMCP